jgi:hypothetical protein
MSKLRLMVSTKTKRSMFMKTRFTIAIFAILTLGLVSSSMAANIAADISIGQYWSASSWLDNTAALGTDFGPQKLFDEDISTDSTNRCLIYDSNLPNAQITWHATDGNKYQIDTYKFMTSGTDRRQPHNWQFLGSNTARDGEWTVLDEVNLVTSLSVNSWSEYTNDVGGAYIYYRMLVSATGGIDAGDGGYLALRELELYGSVGEPGTNLTTAVYGESTNWSATHTSFPGSKLFDSDVTSGGRWLGLASTLPNAFVDWHFTNEIYQVNHYSVQWCDGNATTRWIQTVVFQGSNDGVNFIDLGTVTLPELIYYGSAYKRMISVENPGFYEYYRFKAESNYGDTSYVSAGELRLYGFEQPLMGTLVIIQ